MGIDVRWFNEEKRLIEIVLTDPWDWPDFEQKHLDCLEMTNGLDHKAHCIIEFGMVGRRPQGNALLHLKRLIGRIPRYPNAGYFFLINPHPFARSTISLLSRVYGEDTRMLIASSREDAFQRIQSLTEEADKR